jgi:stress response protein YsnF
MAQPHSPPGSVTLPVIQEKVHVGTTVEETGALRVRLVVEQGTEKVELQCSSEEVTAERVPIGRAARERRAAWMEDDVLVVPIYEEVLVVKRRLMLKEEIRLHTRKTRRVDSAEVPVTRERAIVERRADDGSWVPVDVQTAAPSDAAAPARSSFPDSGPDRHRDEFEE